MKSILLLSIICFANIFCFASTPKDIQKLADSLNVIVHEMAHSGVYEKGLVGIAGRPSQQDIRFRKLKQMASAVELLELTKNPSPIVRLYSFVALQERHENIVSETLEILLNDKAIIVCLTGCLATEKSVGSIISGLIDKSHLNKI